MNVLSLFDGMSCGQIALNELGIHIDNYFACEIKPHAIKTTQYNFPNTIQIGDVTKINANQLPKIDLLIGGSPCFVSGTLIMTDKGMKYIEDIKINDMVLTHKNRFKKVTRTGSSINKEVVELQSNGIEKTFVTLNHPYYTIKKNNNGYGHPEWTNIEDINSNQLIGIPYFLYKDNTTPEYITNNIAWTKPSIKFINEFHNVYNIEVEDDNSYIANNAIVHNCQDFSQANRIRLGDKGKKSSLFWEYVRILDEVRNTNPHVKFMLENVKMKPEHNRIVTDTLHVNPININSKLVSAQLRNRYYWTNISDNISQPTDKNIMLLDILEYGWTERNKSRALLESDSRPLSTSSKMFHRHYAKGFNTLIFKNKEHYLNCKSHYEKYYKGLSGKDITDNPSVYHGVRYFTSTERERLQGIPHGYTKILTQYEAACLLGDGWNVPTIKHILDYL